jgi:hypothetical protein
VNRRVVAGVVLSVWLLVVAWHVRREYFRPEAERLALAARTLPPGVAYFALFRADRRAGWAQTEIDTLPAASGFLIRDRVFLDVPGIQAADSESLTEAWYGPGLDLDSLRHLSVMAADSVRVSAAVEGDSLIRVRAARGDAADSTELRVAGPVALASGWPLRLAAEARARAGDRYAVQIFDPAAGAARATRLRVLSREVVSFPDSADTDSLTGVWMAVREDTVRAWHLTQEMGSLELEVWVDEDGRLVEAELPGGLRMERTAFELAFFAMQSARERVRE